MERTKSGTSEKNRTLTAIGGASPRLGERQTRQRRALYDWLRSRTDHPDAQAILRGVRAAVPGVSPFTVYRNLERFRHEGLVTRIVVWKGRARYDAVTAPHAHFLCTACGALADVAGSCAPTVDVAAFRRAHGEVQGVVVRVEGVCLKCIGQGRPPRSGRRRAAANMSESSDGAKDGGSK